MYEVCEVYKVYIYTYIHIYTIYIYTIYILYIYIYIYIYTVYIYYILNPKLNNIEVLYLGLLKPFLLEAN